jgi:hypothetical protein
MACLLAKIAVGLGLAAPLMTTLSGCAQTSVLAGAYADERCEAVVELPDGTWSVRSPIMFGRTVRVESGATLHEGEVVEGLDLGAVLQRTCRDPWLNVTPTVVRF